MQWRKRKVTRLWKLDDGVGLERFCCHEMHIVIPDLPISVSLTSLRASLGGFVPFVCGIVAAGIRHVPLFN